MSRGATVAIVIVAMVALGGALATPVTLVQVWTNGGDSLVCRRVSRISVVALTFTHSMYGGYVSETWTPGDGGMLRRTGIVTANAAAAEYYAWDGRVRATPDGYEVIAPPLVVEVLPVRVDQVGRHRLTVDGTTYPLADMVNGSAQVRLELTNRPLVTQVFGTRC